MLVHACLDLDDVPVFASLGRLDDLRAFARVVAKLAGEGPPRTPS